MWSGSESVERSWARIVGYGDALLASALPLILWVGLCVAIAGAMAFAARPEFTATAQLVLEPRVIASDGPEVVRLFHQYDLDNEQALTQLAVIQSDRLLGVVFDALALVDAPELSDAAEGVVATSLRRWLAWSNAPSRPDPALAFARFKRRVAARRLALSYVIEISYRAQDPLQAARVANAITSAYARERISVAASDALVGSPYLTRRRDSIRGQFQVASNALKAGTIPDETLSSADVQLLGPAVPPLAQSFPRPGLLCSIAAAIGIVTGLVAVAIRQDVEGRVRSARQLFDRLGVRCLATVPKGRHARTAVTVLHRVRAAVAARGLLNGPCTVGFVDCDDGSGAVELAAGFSTLLSGAGAPVRLLASAGDKHSFPSSEPWSGTTVVALDPSSHDPIDGRLLARMDAVVLVVREGSTRLAEMRVALGFLGQRGHDFIGTVLVNRRRHTKTT